MAKVIRNIDSISHTYCGQLILASESYTIQAMEQIKWANDNTLMTDIANSLAQVNDGSSDISGISNQINYLKDIDQNPRDVDGAAINRHKAAQAGWTYHLTAPEFETSTLASLYHKNATGTDLNECIVKYYNAGNTELTTQGECDTDCVKTVFTFEPTWNYEIIGGTLKTFNDVTVDVRIWVVAVPDVPAESGGSKVMVQNVNLKFIDPNNGIEADGRVSKFMTYSATYHTNKIQVTLKHPAGFKEPIMMAFEVFRA